VKKYLAILLGAVFVLGFAASAFAIHAEIPAETQAVVATGSTAITIGGEIRFRQDFQANTSDFNTGHADDKSYFDSRIRLSVEAKVSPNTTGFVQIEAGSDPDASNSSDLFIWGNNSHGTGSAVGASEATGIYNQGDEKRGYFSVLQAWILHTGSGLLGMPAGIKVGHMPLALGNSIFFDHTKFGDDAIVLFADPVKELHIAVLTAKFREGSLTANDDADAYVALFAYKTKEFGVSGDVTYVDDQLGLGATEATQLPIHFWNFGLRGNVQAGDLGIMADGELQAGKVDVANVNFDGYAVKAGLNYKLAPVTLALDFAYGSGDGGPTSKEKAFVTSQSAIQHFTYVYDYRTKNACGQQYGGLCNTMYVKLGANAPLAKDLAGELGLYWLQAAKKFIGSTALAALEPAEVASTTSKNIGTEIDARITYKIDRNLTWWVEGGYLFAGQFWNNPVMNSTWAPGKTSPDDVYTVRQGIQLSF